MAKEGVTLKNVEPKELQRSVYTKASFEDAEAQLKQMQTGTDIWDMIHQLKGTFLTTNFGGGYVLLMKGYANYDSDKRWQLATERGVYEVWPFGYVERDKEVLKLSVIFRNGKLQRVVPYEPETTLGPHLSEQP
jgi:hypothetical protein